MISILSLLVVGTILLGASLHLEAQTTYKGSIEYNKLKNIGGTGCIMAWVGFIVLSIIGSL